MICNKCHIDKVVEDFHKRSNSKTGYRKSCKECLRKQKVTRVYSISAEEYDDLHLKNSCYICHKEEEVSVYGKVKALSVDHCHSTGKVRGLLCLACNVGLGAFRDDPEILQSAANYLRRSYED